MSPAMRAYLRAPVWLQNLLISAYGLRLRKLRYGPVGQATLADLRAAGALSSEEVRRGQLEALSRVVAAAALDVPFYRDRRFTRINFTSLEQLEELPLLSKSDLQQAGKRCISDRYRDKKLTEIHTGGTTGKPLAIYCDSATLQRNYAFFTHFKERAGVGQGERAAIFAGRTLVRAGAGPPFWRRNRAANALLFSSYHIGPTTLALYIQALREFSPALIDAYPSAIEPIARYMIEHGISDIRPKAVITSSETLFPEVKQAAERAFGCKVFDHYGSAEMVALITQCARGVYHPEPLFGIVEILNDGHAVGPGERGEIVATGFVNPVMPLIRYQMGDWAVRGRGPCPCGRPGETIERIEGRMDDVIVTPEGNLVGRLDPIFKSVSSLYETRIVQDEVDHLRVELVASDAFTRDMQRELEAQLRARVGRTMRIDFVRLSSIERTAAGKLRTTVNLVHRRPDSVARHEALTRS